jgi:hypothetical protein
MALSADLNIRKQSILRLPFADDAVLLYRGCRKREILWSFPRARWTGTLESGHLKISSAHREHFGTSLQVHFRSSTSFRKTSVESQAARKYIRFTLVTCTPGQTRELQRKHPGNCVNIRRIDYCKADFVSES